MPASRAQTAIRRCADATGRLASGLQTSVPALAGLFALPVLVLVLPFAPGILRPWRALAGVERERVGKIIGHRIPAPYRPLPSGHWQRVWVSVTDPATWRELAWCAGNGILGSFAALIAIGLWPGIVSSLTTPLWWWAVPGSTSMFVEVGTWTQALTLAPLQAVCYVAILYWLVPLGARAQVRAAERLLGPSDRSMLAQEVERLTETRTEALVSHGAELRRIERDLHDGVQAQLVAVAVRLGLAERALQAEPAAKALLQDARAGIEESLGSLRGVIRGIYPPILADRGLGGAVHALAGGQRVPVAVRIPDDLPRPPAPIEAAAYFVVAESLTNIAKHSNAGHAEVTVESDGATLKIVVRDDGQGGADQAAGSGLLGIQRRIAALDGTARIHSPADEGTTIEVLLPCA